MRKFFTSLFLIIICLGGNKVQAISVTQSLSESEIAFEDSLFFEIVLTWDGPQNAYFFEKPLIPKFDRLKVRAFSSAISSSLETGSEITTKKYDYVLIPTSSGSASIDPVSISYVSWPDSIPGELVTEPMTAEIADPVKRDEKGNNISWIWIVVIGLIVLGGFGTFILRVINKKNEIEPHQSPKENFLEKLTETKENAGSDLKKFQTGLYAILATYINDLYKIDVSKLSDNELKEKLVESGINDISSDKIVGWLSRAHQDKFSPITSLPGETIRLEAEIRDFFEKL